jgi:hypothetical protein
MKLPVIALCFLLAGTAAAQRGGMGGMRGGAGMGGARGGVGAGMQSGRSSGFGGARSGSGVYGFRPGTASGLFRNGFHDGYGTRFGLYGGYYVPYGWNLGYFPGFYDYGYPYAYDYSYGSAAPAYNYSPGVNIVYPPASPASNTIYVERATPVIREYDQAGNERQISGDASATANSSPIYLIAFQDHTIRAAAAYWVDGKTLHYVTLQHEEKQTPLDGIDRDFTLQLNRERRVTIQLP